MVDDERFAREYGPWRPVAEVATHDLEDAAVLGERIGVLLGSTLAQLDPPERLFQRPASLAVARFLGIPNLVAGSMAEGHFVSVLGRIPLPDRPPAGPATAAFGSDALYPDPLGSLRGIMRGVRHGPRGATLRVEVAGLELDATAPVGGMPRLGEELSLALETPRVAVLPGAGDV